MEITELTPTPFVLPTAGDLVHIRTQRWALERWKGDDPPGLATPWARKPKFSVNGSRSCAELAVVDHLRGNGWRGVWVNAFRGELRSEWFPAAAARTLAEAGAPQWAVEIFGRQRAANEGTLSGFFDVFAWREPGQVGFYEAKVGPDRIKPTHLRFVEVALRLHRPEEFMIVEMTGPSSRSAPPREPGKAADRTRGGRWLASPPRMARAFCGGPGATCCRRSAASLGSMSRKPARCSATWPPPSKRAVDYASQRRGRKRCRPGSSSAAQPPAGRPGLHVAHRFQPTPAGPRFGASQSVASSKVPKNILRTEGVTAGSAWSSILSTQEQLARWSRLLSAAVGPEVKSLKIRPSPARWRASSSALVCT
jgi:hypothetical protein